MKNLFIILLLSLLTFLLTSLMKDCSNPKTKHQVYLIPGQGSDYRIFKNLSIDTNKYSINYLEWLIPNKKEKMSDFAKRMADQIDTNSEFSLIGVSLGGMIAVEMNDFLSPTKTIIISSAKSRKEIPAGYKFQKYFPINKLVSKKLIKTSAIFLQPIYEKDSKLEEETCKSMLNDKDPVFLKRTVDLIINWERKEINPYIVHIHGEIDNTLPIKNVTYNHMIKNGSHMMTLTKADTISSIINKELENVFD